MDLNYDIALSESHVSHLLTSTPFSLLSLLFLYLTLEDVRQLLCMLYNRLLRQVRDPSCYGARPISVALLDSSVLLACLTLLSLIHIDTALPLPTAHHPRHQRRRTPSFSQCGE